jgi:hypothetical protein
VNNEVDEVDSAPGDSGCVTARAVCTLCAPIEDADALPGNDTIVTAHVLDISSRAVYTLFKRSELLERKVAR